MVTQIVRSKSCKTSTFVTAASLAVPLLPRTAMAAEGARTTASGRRLATMAFEPTWESLVKNYKHPEWNWIAKFGIAIADSGRLAGPWRQQDEPIFKDNGEKLQIVKELPST
jgi:hypothetical protein